MLQSADDFEELSDDEMEARNVQEGRTTWLSEARNVYDASTDYIESSVRSQWERNLYNFQGRHRDEKDRKSKIFRPKVRSSLRGHEASLAAALFTNNDITSIEGVNPNDKLQEKSAELVGALVEHRLTKTIPWFQTVMGAYQDANVYGCCISKTYWEFEMKDIIESVPALDDEGELILDEEGYPVTDEMLVGREVVSDKPVIDLIAPENFRYDPNADWRNPLEDSPYLIEIMPMYAGDVLERMGKVDEKTGAPEWFEYELSEVVAAASAGENESIRQAREGVSQDPVEINVKSKHQTVWVHFNIIKKDGVDMAFYTLGTTLLLSDPVPLTDYFKLGRETYRLGVSSIETHKNNPASLAELGENLQNEVNLLAQQRIENVRLVLNKRYFIRNQGNVDLAALMRNVPGGGVMIEDPNNDVRVIDTPDITSSSYAEQDRLNMDIDEILGTFSQSTVASNRQLNETVGGMNLMASATNTIQEYIMRIFIETWVEPVIRTLVKLEQMYETDQVILAIAQDKAGIKEEMAKFAGNPEVLDKLIQQDLTVRINVGMGNTNPEQKVKRIMLAINATANMPGAAEKTDWEEVVKEVFSYAGYGDGARFLKGKDAEQVQPPPPPEVQLEQMKQQGRQAEQQAKQQHEAQMKQMELQAAQQSEQMKAELSVMETNGKRELELAKLASDESLRLEEYRTKLGIESSKDKTNRELGALKASLASREMAIKLQTGSGI